MIAALGSGSLELENAVLFQNGAARGDFMNIQKLFGSKTFWTALIGLASAGVAFAFGEIKLPEFAGAVFVALQAIFLRDAIAKNGATDSNFDDSRQP